MSDTERGADRTPLNPPDVPLEDQVLELGGRRSPEDQEDATFDAADIGEAETGLTGTEIYQGYLEAGVDPSGTDESVDALTDRELRSGETSDPFIAADEGLTYVPPVDPPVVPSDDPEGIEVAAGTATTAMDDPFDADHHDAFLSGEDEMSDRVREALRADAATTAYAGRLGIATEGGVVTLRGTVDDIEDSDAIAEVAARVTGVEEVRDETEVEGL